MHQPYAGSTLGQRRIQLPNTAPVHPTEWEVSTQWYNGLQHKVLAQCWPAICDAGPQFVTLALPMETITLCFTVGLDQRGNPAPGRP